MTMREILFKAKRIDNGEWVEGFIDIHTFVPLEESKEPYLGTVIKKVKIRPYDYESYEVDESTICQYTGLTDRNGKKIWENDVVEITQENGKFIIEWNETEAKWQMNNYAEEFIVDFDNYWSYNTEVIGNIFDNPELINE